MSMIVVDGGAPAAGPVRLGGNQRYDFRINLAKWIRPEWSVRQKGRGKAAGEMGSGVRFFRKNPTIPSTTGEAVGIPEAVVWGEVTPVNPA